MEKTRREFMHVALATVPATIALTHGELAAFSAPQKPNSKWAGVQVGINTPLSLSMGNYVPLEQLIARLTSLNISGVELRAQPVELFLGSPEAVAAAASAATGRGGGRGGGGRGGGGRGAATPEAGAPPQGGGRRGAAGDAGAGQAPAAGRARGAAPTPEQEAARREAAEATRKWRMGVSMDRVREFRKIFETAGIAIEVVKWDGILDFSPDEVDYAFEVSKALGAMALSTEMVAGRTKAVGQIADKHRMLIGYHNHAGMKPEVWEAAFAEARYNGANVDIGHFVAGNNVSPLDFMKKYSERVSHIHVKDRRKNEGATVPFGEGETPVREILQAMRDNKWNFQATLEPAYAVPEGSTLDRELTRCLEYCRASLLG